MKKFVYLFASAVITTLVATSLTVNNRVIEVKADELETYIVMDEDFFTNYDGETNGSFANQDATFWGEGYSFNALDTFFRGEIKENRESAESWTGTLTSRSWKQKSQYIYFTWGAANNKRVKVDPEDENSEEVLKMKMVIHCGDKEFTKENDTFVGNPMMLDYFKIPDEDFASFNGEDFDMSIDLVDGLEGDYGFHNFGYLHVNQSEEQVSDAMRFYINNMEDGKRYDIEERRNWEINKRKEIYGHYFTNAGLKEVFLRTVNNIDEDFESNDLFLNHWYTDPNYDNNNRSVMHMDKAISDVEYRFDGTSHMPFNKTGNKFFKGWHDNDEVGGFVNGDGSIYRFISRPFVLNDLGIVSIKMAGRSASLHVIDTDTQTDLAWADVCSYSSTGSEDNIVSTGFNTVTMVRHIINLEEYAGKTIQLAISDVYDSGWAASYFDELKVSYTAYPSFKVDVVSQTNESGTFYAAYPDKYIASTHIDNEPDWNGLKYAAGKDDITRVDETPLFAAYKFLNGYYYPTFRSEHSSICSITDELATELETKYDELSTDVDAKAIVDASEDFDRGNDKESLLNWYEKSVNKNHLVEEGVAFIVSGEYKNVLYHGPTFIDNINGPFFVIVIAILTSFITLIGVVLLKKKKHK